MKRDHEGREVTELAHQPKFIIISIAYKNNRKYVNGDGGKYDNHKNTLYATFRFWGLG
ncbi:MAG: hypothetical protein ACI9AP_001054 [Flavobacteriales bacterium]